MITKLQITGKLHYHRKCDFQLSKRKLGYRTLLPLTAPIGWPTEDGKSRAETRAVIGYRLCWAQSAGIKVTANGENLMSVACPATRRDGRRRVRLRKRKWETSNFKLESSNCESENPQTWNCESEKLQTATVKIFKLESSNLKVKISKLKPQTTKVKVFKVKSRKFSTSKFR